ncbi:MAG: hypothetical protein HZB56_19115 [Deltaproteobacteria bacterium]|nr:hypothetical protein [Deltaproteobacteria bacterium]
MSTPRLLLGAVALLLAAGCARRDAAPAAAAEPPGYRGPRLEILSPGRGARLAEGGADPSSVAVRGRACDEAHALTSVRVADQAVPVSGPGPCHAFEIAVPARWGLTVLDGEVVNEAGQRGTLAQAFLRSPAWFSPGAEAPAALVVQVGPSLLDDGDRATADDLATLLERALSALDLDASAGPLRFADPDEDGDLRLDTHRYDCLLYTTTNKVTGFEAWKSGPVTRGAVTVERLALAQGGIAARLSVRELRVPFSVTGNLDSGCLGAAQDTVSGDAWADALTLEAEAQVRLGASGRPEVVAGSVTATLAGLRLLVDLGPLDFVGLGSAIGDAVAAQAQGPAQEAMAAAVTALLEERLAAALAAITTRSDALRLPPEVGGGELRLGSRLDTVDFTPARGILATSLALEAATPLPAHGGERGAMLLGGDLPDASGLAASALAVGVKDDALQQLLHAAWQAGAFDRAELALPADGDFPGGTLALSPLLPPVLMPSPGGAPWMDLGLGDVAFVLRLPAPRGTAEARGFLSAVLPVERLEAGPDGLRILFGGGAVVRVQVDEVNWGDPVVSGPLLAELLQRGGQALLPRLLGTSLGPFPLPALDLASLDPAFAGLAVRLGSPQLSRLGRYQFLSADLVAVP